MIITNSKLNGRYELESQLGEGTFGITYLARDTHMHSQYVVVKVLREAGTEVDRELKALTRIHHPNVVRVSDHGRTPNGDPFFGRPFFVMQYVKGKSLRIVLEEGGGMELKRAAQIVRQLGSAVGAVHDDGVVHRDIKPDNIMLQPSGNDEFAILIDFGLARIQDSRMGRGGQESWAGTPFYMAPEQLRGEARRASDVWALGVVTYEMVTGRKPFSPADVIELERGPRAFAEPTALRPELPEAAQDVILKALSYEPSRRYAHAREMGEAFLRAVLDPKPTSPPQPMQELPEELRQRCQELFETFDEFRSPDSLHAFFAVAELRAYRKCIGRGGRLEFDQLLHCLFHQAGRDYQGQALIDLLGVLASRYRGDYRAQACERLKGALGRVLERAPAAGR